MNIEKLGLTPGPWKMLIKKKIGEEDRCLISAKGKSKNSIKIIMCSAYSHHTPSFEDAKLIAAAPEMLRYLINRIFSDYQCVLSGDVDLCDIEDDIKLLEKATGKTWEELKELIK